jgi:exopolysaccharide biosynthesis polyprenyl glycosylphosphotransferase
MIGYSEMAIHNKRESFLLFIGDLIAFSLALWLALVVRYGSIPSVKFLSEFVVPFSVLFLLWIFIFFVAGLYEKHTLVFKSRLPYLILNTQIVNSLLAVVFFYLFPFFGITPKIVLAVHLIISFLLIILWRIRIVPYFDFHHHENALLIGTGHEMQELKKEMNNNGRYNLTFISSIDLDKLNIPEFQEEVVEKVYSEGITSIVIDLKHKKADAILPSLYNLIFSNVRFLDMHKVYEEVFDRTPLSLVGYNWFLENISSSPHTMYDSLKRVMDIIISGILSIVLLILYPFVLLAIKLDDGGPVFISQYRIGRGNHIIKLWKFRSMMRKDSDEGVWVTDGDDRITRIGKILRKSRLDELPQIWSVLKGDISLIGPRPDIEALGKKLSHELPYYTVRNLIKPGLSGWAQIKQDIAPQSLEETRERLAYDLYYLKNRSFFLDLTIALKTIKTLLSRTGR